MKIKKLLLVLTILCMLMLNGCGKKCENGCGNSADPDCMAGMCDDCCDYYMGLNGCRANHYDSKWD